MPPRLHVSLAFAQLPDAELLTFGNEVYGGLVGNVNYTTLPTDATLAMLTAAIDAFSGGMTGAADGGQTATAHKNNMRGALLEILYLLATYVELNCKQNLEILRSSGFKAANQERRREPLPKPASVAVKAGEMEGQLVAAVKPPIKNTSMYEGRASIDGGVTWLPSIFTGDSRHITFNGLTPGAMYTIQIRALGGSTMFSEWSDAVQHRAP